jgi:hypothetical protein
LELEEQQVVLVEIVELMEQIQVDLVILQQVEVKEEEQI